MSKGSGNKGTSNTQAQTSQYQKPITVVTSSSLSDKLPKYDDSSSGEESDHCEGSLLRCTECDIKFMGVAQQMAIGCNTPYCQRWFHRECVDLNLEGLSNKEIADKGFNFKYC